MLHFQIFSSLQIRKVVVEDGGGTIILEDKAMYNLAREVVVTESGEGPCETCGVTP